MINIDPETGDASGVALKVLAGYRRERANILFGQFLALEPLSPRTATPPPASAAGARILGEDPVTGIGTGASGGRYTSAVERGINSSSGNGGNEKNPAVQAPAVEEVLNGEGRVSWLDSEEAVGKANVSPGTSAVGGWKFWVSEGMEVASEA